jgi:hypothetical protein
MNRMAKLTDLVERAGRRWRLSSVRLNELRTIVDAAYYLGRQESQRDHCNHHAARQLLNESELHRREIVIDDLLARLEDDP